MRDSTMVFQDEVHGRPEVVVNFGVFAGREATQAEIDRLAQQVGRIEAWAQDCIAERNLLGS